MAKKKPKAINPDPVYFTFTKGKNKLLVTGVYREGTEWLVDVKNIASNEHHLGIKYDQLKKYMK